MSRGQGAKVPFIVAVAQKVVTVVNVEALTIEEAITLAEAEAKTQRPWDEFEDTDAPPMATSVMDSGGNQLWCAEDDETPP